MDPSTAITSGPRARLSQLVRVLGKPVEEVVALVSIEGVVATEADWVPAEVVDRILAGYQPRRDPKDLRPVVARVIRERVEHGDEYILLPVLKNQLLDLTNRAFHESDYGWPNMKFLPRGFPDLLQLEDTNAHGSARILDNAVAIVAAAASEGETGSVFSAIASRLHVRQDLWDAVIDYRSESTYVWDPDSGRAVRSTNPAEDHRRRFPTVTADNVRSWRDECAQDWLVTHPGSARDDVERWVQIPRQLVPQLLIRQWQALQRNKVVGIVEQFFATESLPLPADAFPSSRVPERYFGSDSQLTPRQLLHAAAAVMTDRELEALQLPLAIVVRALKTPNGTSAPRR